MEKVFGTVILYNPPPEIHQHIQTYLDKVEKLFVFDNSESVTPLDLEVLGDKIVFLADGVNRGLPERLNAAAHLAISEQGSWLLTMDQDSFFLPGELDSYLSCLKHVSDRQHVGMFGVQYEKRSDDFDCAMEETTNLITSGSLVNLGCFQEIGGFDEQLFIDEVDAEYCFRSNKHGYRTIRFNNIFLNHSLGIVSMQRSLKNFKITRRTLHSPLRVYYMVRNFLYVSSKYRKDQPATFPDRKAAVLNRVKNNFLYGKDRLLLLKYLWLAYRHFKGGKMGKLK